jgi:AAA+ superfamily predicted ATPase
VGQTSQNIRAIYEFVKTNPNILLFIDEAEGAFGQRIAHVQDAASQGINNARNTILVEMENYKGIQFFATNTPNSFDFAAGTRLLESIKFELPDTSSRAKIFSLQISPKLPIDNDVCINRLADLTQGFSGREIRNVVRKVVYKTASQKGALETDYMATMNLFIEAIEEVRQGQIAINSQPKNLA